jgi:hypothetical protein
MLDGMLPVLARAFWRAGVRLGEESGDAAGVTCEGVEAACA